MDRAALELRDLGERRLVQAQHQVRLREQLRAVGRDVRAGLRVILVRVAGTGAEPGLDGDLRTRPHQFLDARRDHRGATFPRLQCAWNSDQHTCCLLSLGIRVHPPAEEMHRIGAIIG